VADAEVEWLGVPEVEADDVRLAVLDPLEEVVSRCVGVVVALAVTLPEGVIVDDGVSVPVCDAVLAGDAEMVADLDCVCDRDIVKLGDPLGLGLVV